MAIAAKDEIVVLEAERDPAYAKNLSSLVK